MSKLRSEQEIIGVALLLKRAMVLRRKEIELLAGNIGRSAAGIAHDIKPSRLETMNDQLDRLRVKQEIGSERLATLRWVLGLTDEIDPLDIALDV